MQSKVLADSCAIYSQIRARIYRGSAAPNRGLLIPSQPLKSAPPNRGLLIPSQPLKSEGENRRKITAEGIIHV